MGALTKAEMAEMLFEDLGLNKREAKEIVEKFYGEITRLDSTTKLRRRDLLFGQDSFHASGTGTFD